MQPDDSDRQAVFLGVGEAATVRWPTKDEEVQLKMQHLDPVLVISHVDRDPDVIPVIGLTIAPRPYGIAS